MNIVFIYVINVTCFNSEGVGTRSNNIDYMLTKLPILSASGFLNMRLLYLLKTRFKKESIYAVLCVQTAVPVDKTRRL